MVDAASLVRFAEVGQQGHRLGAPRGSHVLLDALGEVISPGHRHDEAAEAPTGERGARPAATTFPVPVAGTG